MPLYEYSCACGTRFEKLVPFADADSPSASCPSCGGTGCRRLPSSAALLGRASPPPGRDAAPRSWEETNGGDRDTILHWQRTLERRRKLEEKYPELSELSGDSRPVLAHEGPYAAHPLHAPATVPGAPAPRSPDPPAPRSPDPPASRSADPPAPRSPDPPASRSADPPAPRSAAHLPHGHRH